MFLPSGGSLVIDRTEAMTVIDVNTGKYTGTGGNLEETVTRNNLEAAEEIVRQLRLRDLGGIIVIDFIDMVLESNRELVLRRLTECLGRDRTKHQVTEITSLGLVQMTRKRIGQGLLEAFSETCEHCKGRGVIIHLDPVPERKPADQGAAGSRRRAKRHRTASQRRPASRRGAGVAVAGAVSAPTNRPPMRPIRRRGRPPTRSPARTSRSTVDTVAATVPPPATTNGYAAAVPPPPPSGWVNLAAAPPRGSDAVVGAESVAGIGRRRADDGYGTRTSQRFRADSAARDRRAGERVRRDRRPTPRITVAVAAVTGDGNSGAQPPCGCATRRR